MERLQEEIGVERENTKLMKSVYNPSVLSASSSSSSFLPLRIIFFRKTTIVITFDPCFCLVNSKLHKRSPPGE